MKLPFIIILFISLSFTTSAQEIKDVVFTNFKAPYTHNAFYIKDIRDIRTDTVLIGTINTSGNKTISYRLKKGLSNTLLSLVKKVTIPDTSKTAIEINLSKFEISKTTVNSKRYIRLDVTLTLIANGYKLSEISKYYLVTALPDPSLSIEPLTTNFLKVLFEELDIWLVTNKDNIVPVAQVEIKILDSSDIKSLLVYNLGYRLSMSDFEGSPKGDDYFNIFCDYSYKYHYEHHANRVIAKYTITPYMDKLKSWVANKNDIEQLFMLQGYFDIEALKACQLKKVVEVSTFSHDNFISEFEQKVYDVNYSFQSVEDQYRNAVMHETDINKIKVLADKIHTQVVKCGCYL